MGRRRFFKLCLQSWNYHFRVYHSIFALKRPNHSSIWGRTTLCPLKDLKFLPPPFHPHSLSSNMDRKYNHQWIKHLTSGQSFSGGGDLGSIKMLAFEKIPLKCFASQPIWTRHATTFSEEWWLWGITHLCWPFCDNRLKIWENTMRWNLKH